MNAYDDLLELYVRPYYLSLMHANFMSRSDRHEHFPAYLRLAASTVGASQLRRLLRDRDWRPGLVAGWFAGLSGKNELVETIANRLARNTGAYDEQGLCVGLGLLGGSVAQHALWTYLNNTLSCSGNSSQQSWAFGALAYLEGTSPQRYIKADVWPKDFEPDRAIQKFADVVAFLRSEKIMPT